MNKRRFIQIIIALLFFLTKGTAAMWAAVGINDIKVSDPIGGSVEVKSVVEQTSGDYKVTMEAVPDEGYEIKKNDFIVQPVTNPSLTRQTQAPGIATALEVENGSSDNEFYFLLPSRYNGAIVTVTFNPTYALPIDNLSGITNPSGKYKFSSNFNFSSPGTPANNIGTRANPFKGSLEGYIDESTGVIKSITLSAPLFEYVKDATIKNIIVKGTISGSGNVGAIAGNALGDTRIYNCGVLATAQYDAKGNFTGFGGSTISGGGYVGGIVGFLDGSSRVINCYNYANILGGSNRGGIVGWNNVATTSTNVKTMVMNCMFYGNITGGSMRPIFGGKRISNAGETAVNLYNYYRNGEDVTFDDDYTSFDDYYCALPADEDYLTRFEYYRSILNSNRQLCVWWITGHVATAQTADDGKLMAKWVLDPTIAPYPILKKWGKYPSVINRDKDNVWNPISKENISRTSANPYQGKKLNTITVNVDAGVKHAGTGSTLKTLTDVIVLDMDTLNHDYGYYKIQLPYYNDVFGDPSVVIPAPSADDYLSKWNQRYGGNYKDYVVTGWKITNISGGTTGSFKGYGVTSAPSNAVSAGTVTPDVTTGNPWEDGFNFADRNCTNKDLYSKSGRVFAQGGYYYVPEGVNTITIEAYWGKAVYLHNKDHSMDRVSVANVSADGKDGDGDTTGADFGYSFSPAGTLATTFQGYTVYTNLQDAISNLALVGTSYTVYDQAIVLVGNVQVKNRGASLGRASDKPAYNRPFTIMSCDLDMDNEPDFCLQLQQRNTVNRPGIHPIRFDFLPVPELGLAIRANDFAYAIGLMVPQGHFEITETALMHTTQFEYDAAVGKVEAPLILNGGDFEQMVLRYGPKDGTSYILMGGNFSLTRFTPGWHANNTKNGGNIRHCAVNAIGGNYSEFYLSGIYHPDFSVNQDNPHCYVNGGKYGIMAGAGYEQVNGSVTFQIDHSVIREFYGGGINGSKPVTGDITVTINNSLVDKYCGGPKVGSMAYIDNEVTKYKTVTTNAKGTTFGVYYGGGNGGTSYYRQNIKDYTGTFPNSDSGWEGFSKFNPLNQVSGVTTAYDNGTDKKGYHAEYEFEVFNSSNGLKSGEDVIRTYYNWAQFGTTTTGNVTSTLTDCTVKGNFYGGGNLANVIGTVTSTLNGKTHVYGSAFGAGFSASVPSFRVHDKTTVKIPTKDSAGNVDEKGSLDYYKDGVEDRYYKWSNEKPSGVSTSKPTFQDDDGNWYCYTEVSLTNLGTVTGNVTLNIEGTSVVEGKIDIGKTTEKQAGGVFGGGDASEVVGNTTVTIKATGQQSGYTYNTYNVFGGGNEANVQGNASAIMNNGIVSQSVYGGGNEANVTGNTTVTLAGNAEVFGDVFGGGNNGEVGGTATVNIQPTIE